MPDGFTTLVTGGAGFIGSHLVAELVRRGHDVTVVDDLSTGTVDNLDGGADRIRFVEGDVEIPEIAVLATGADLVFHLAVRNVRASINQPEENFRVNATGTLRLLEAMRTGARGRFVYVSSSEVYGDPHATDFAESTLPAPITMYGAGKLAGELVTQAYHRTYGMDTRVIRPFNNYGPRSHFEGDSGEVIPKFIIRALENRPLHVHGDGTQTRDFMYVEDTAYWLAELAEVESLVGDTVNIGTGTDHAVNDLARHIIDATGSRSIIEYGDPRPGDLPRLRADVTKVKHLVDFDLPTGFEEGMRRTIEYFAAQDTGAFLELEVERNWE